MKSLYYLVWYSMYLYGRGWAAPILDRLGISCFNTNASIGHVRSRFRPLYDPSIVYEEKVCSNATIGMQSPYNSIASYCVFQVSCQWGIRKSLYTQKPFPCSKETIENTFWSSKAGAWGSGPVHWMSNLSASIYRDRSLCRNEWELLLSI